MFGLHIGCASHHIIRVQLHEPHWQNKCQERQIHKRFEKKKKRIEKN